MSPFAQKLKPAVSVIRSEKDEEVFARKPPKWTPLFRSPLAEDHLGDATAYAQAPAETPGTVSSLGHAMSHGYDSDDELEMEKHEDGAPRLHRAKQTSVVQLFYDLFFVAVLTTFTSAKEINDTDNLRAYIGFFVILWSTWFQVAKYDVRFGTDSAFERICKALQFGVMVGFAITGPYFVVVFEPDTLSAVYALQSYQVVSLILMASRLILMVQYMVTFWWLRAHPKAFFPLVVHIVTEFVAAMIFLGLFFNFAPSSPGNTGVGIAGWYVVLTVEAVIILVVSGYIRFMSFRHTPMVERLGLLTLIILGEGIIGLCEKVGSIGYDNTFNPDVIGQIISSVGIVYFIWMLYHDQTEKKRVGRLRQELWTILHFPFHIAILLVVEGQATLTVWVKILDLSNPVYNATNSPIFDNAFDNSAAFPTEAALTTFANTLNATVQFVYSDLGGSIDESITGAFDSLIHPQGDWGTLVDSVNNITAATFVFICENFNIEAPESSGGADGEDQVSAGNNIVDIFFTVFTYFFVASGLTLIFLTLLLRLGRRENYRSEMFALIFRFAMGIGLSLMALMNLPSLENFDNAAIFNYLPSPWVIPTVLICYGLVFTVDNIVANHIRKRYLRWANGSVA